VFAVQLLRTIITVKWAGISIVECCLKWDAFKGETSRQCSNYKTRRNQPIRKVTSCNNSVIKITVGIVFFLHSALRSAINNVAAVQLLGWISRRWDVGIWTGLDWPRIETGACECGNEPSGSVKCGEFLDYLQTS